LNDRYPKAVDQSSLRFLNLPLASAIKLGASNAFWYRQTFSNAIGREAAIENISLLHQADMVKMKRSSIVVIISTLSGALSLNSNTL
jgi:hypothetical protein